MSFVKESRLEWRIEAGTLGVRLILGHFTDVFDSHLMMLLLDHRIVPPLKVSAET